MTDPGRSDEAGSPGWERAKDVWSRKVWKPTRNARVTAAIIFHTAAPAALPAAQARLEPAADPTQTRQEIRHEQKGSEWVAHRNEEEIQKSVREATHAPGREPERSQPGRGKPEAGRPRPAPPGGGPERGEGGKRSRERGR